MSVERLSIEVTNRCSKHCHFCYNSSHGEGETRWTPDELVSFVADCARSGTQAVSFGGGEPLEYPGLFEVLERLRGSIFRSITSNGLLLRDRTLEDLVAVRPDKVHLSIHFPEKSTEVDRAIDRVKQLEALGIRSGVNLLVAKSNITAAIQAARKLRDVGIGSDRIIYLPMRKADTPSPKEVARVAETQPFQSMTCLMSCHRSSRFCAISWDKKVGWCSYTTARRPLPSLTARGLETALENLPLVFCG
ncbi:radical SAM protein [Baaleninema simplex]|uniref:radical SAM protein n=1 Tax=Baaleninema simplex TaxID=2862350 RepID=UPI00034645C3|nr:radical SAM protein [Baaleninema simplex]